VRSGGALTATNPLVSLTSAAAGQMYGDDRPALIVGVHAGELSVMIASVATGLPPFDRYSFFDWTLRRAARQAFILEPQFRRKGTMLCAFPVATFLVPTLMQKRPSATPLAALEPGLHVRAHSQTIDLEKY
jgi:hypothetical protein